MGMHTNKHLEHSNKSNPNHDTAGYLDKLMKDLGIDPESKEYDVGHDKSETTAKPASSTTAHGTHKHRNASTSPNNTTGAPPATHEANVTHGQKKPLASKARNTSSTHSSSNSTISPIRPNLTVPDATSTTNTTTVSTANASISSSSKDIKKTHRIHTR